MYNKHMCVRACVRACVRVCACVRACACVCVRSSETGGQRKHRRKRVDLEPSYAVSLATEL